MQIVNIPSEYKTDLEKTKYMYRLFEKIRLEGNKIGWNEKLTAQLNFWTKEVLKYRDKLTEDQWLELKDNWKKDNTLNAKLTDLGGF